MEFLLDITTSLKEHYTIPGIALIVLMLCAFVAQIWRYIAYARVAGFRLSRRATCREQEPPVSVIVPIFSENQDYLDSGLLTLLTQEYAAFEVVAVYVGNDDNFYADLKHLHNAYPHLTTTQIKFSPRYPITNKTALNIGIKTARNECIVITSTDARPASERWLSLMAKGFMYGDIVLGYSNIEQQPTITNLLFRKYGFTDSLAWITSSIAGKTYGATRHNYGFTKSLYFSVRGFNYLSLNAGEDDLFIESIASATDASIVLSPRARCTEQCWGGWGWYTDRAKDMLQTRKYYPTYARNYTDWELCSRFVFQLSAIATLVLMPLELKILAAVLIVLRYIIVSFALMRAANRIGERGIAAWGVLFDLIEPAMRIFLRNSKPRRADNQWR